MACLCVAIAASACAQSQRKGGVHGFSHTHRSELPPGEAARCFARNTEEHSSALVAEVSGDYVTVRVKNGVTYGTAAYRRSGSGSLGTITLNVTTPGRRNDLFNALVAGC
jgi:hypothetical protein